MVTIISYPNNTINQTLPIDDTLNSSEILKYVKVDCSLAVDEKYIEVTYNNEVVTLLLVDECRYKPLDIHFINKEGAQQVLTFFKAQKENINITDETYEGNEQPATFNHQFNRYNIQAKKKFDVNSGFIDESLNEDFTQLLLSKKVWLYDDELNYIPLNVSSTSLEYKTRQNDRLINYNIKFDYAFNEINTI